MEPMFVPIGLKTLSGQFFGGQPSNAGGIIEYTNSTGYHKIYPDEGPAAGGMNCTIFGNYTRLGDALLEVSFGGVLVAE